MIEENTAKALQLFDQIKDVHLWDKIVIAHLLRTFIELERDRAGAERELKHQKS